MIPSTPAAWTPESVLFFICFAVIAVLICLVGWFMKKQLETIITNIETFKGQQATCRETLSLRFADKDQTRDHINELYTRTDRHEKVLTRHSVLLGNGESHG